MSLNANSNKYAPFIAGSSTSIQLPKYTIEKHAVVNVENDVFCFLWSVVAALHPAKIYADLRSSYPHFNSLKLKYDEIKCSVTLHDISKYEQLNII